MDFAEIKYFLDVNMGSEWATYISLLIGVLTLIFGGKKIISNRKQIVKNKNGTVIQTNGDKSPVHFHKD